MKKIKLIKILAGFFALMLLFTFLSRAADSVNVAQVETKTAQNQVITHEVTGTGKVMGTRERAVFTQEGQKVEQVYVQEGQNVKKGDALLKFSVKYLKKTIKEKQDAIDVLQGKINDLISAESVNQQKRNNEFSDAQENYNSAVSSGNYSVQAAQNEAAIARQKLQDYYAQRRRMTYRIRYRMRRSSVIPASLMIREIQTISGIQMIRRTPMIPEIRIAQMAKGIKIHQETATIRMRRTILRSRH